MSQERRIRELADAAGMTNDGSVLSTEELRGFLRRSLNSLTYRRRDNLTQRYEQGDMSRRDFVKVLGATAIGATAAAYGLDNLKKYGITGQQVGDGNYDTVTVSSGQTHSVSVGGGETLSNKLYDITASGAKVHITASGNDWTIANIGVKGNHPGGNYMITPGVSGSDGNGLIENVYLGDGQTPRSGAGGIWVNANLPHQGTISFRNLHVAGMVDNGLYGSGPGAQGACGNLHIEDSFAYNNTISNFRTNAKCRECTITGSTVLVDGNNPPCGEGCSAPGSQNTRAIWSWYGTTRVEDSDIRGAPIATAKGGNVAKKNTRTGSDADTAAPDGVPMSAAEAASGKGSGGYIANAGENKNKDSEKPC